MKLVSALLLALCLSFTNAIAGVNVNTATQAELETLNGIGPAKAKAIIDHRTKNGPFKTLEDLDKVPGIGEGTLSKIRKDVTLTGATTVKTETKGSAKAAKEDKGRRSAEDKKAEKSAAPESKKETRKEGAKELKKEEPKAAKKGDEKSAVAKEAAGSKRKDEKKSSSTADDKKAAGSK